MIHTVYEDITRMIHTVYEDITRMMHTVREDIFTFMIIYSHIFIHEKWYTQKVQRKSKHTSHIK